MIRRFAPVAAIGLALWALVAALAWYGVSAEARDAERRREDLFRDVARRIEAAVRRDFDEFIEAEAHRPFYHYQFFYVPETVAGGAGVSRSPLKDLFHNRYARHYFQIDDQSNLTTPYWNRDLPGANEGVAEPERRLCIERDIARRFGPMLRLLFAEEPRPAPASVGEAQVMVQQADNVRSNFDQSAQNAFFSSSNIQAVFPLAGPGPDGAPFVDANGNRNPSTVQEFSLLLRNGTIADVSGAIRMATSGTTTAAPSPDAFEVRYSSFASIPAREGRLLLRRVNAGGRRLLQGFEIDAALAAATVSATAEPLLLAGMALAALEEPAGTGTGTEPTRARASILLDVGGLRISRSLVDRAPLEAASALPGRRALAIVVVGALGLLLAAALTALFRFTAERVAFARERSLFTAAVSHELRTPLAGLKLHAEMLEKGWVRGDPRAYAGRIRGEAERLTRLVENVLDVTRLERGEAIRVDPRPIDPREPARRAHALFAPSFEERGGLHLEIDEASVPPLAPLDPDAFAQILANLLDNALRHGKGAVRLRLAGEQVPSAGVRFEVEDEGAGLGPEEARRAFDQLYAHSPARGSKGGLGLGLAMVRRLAIAHGGRAACAGSRFTVEVPLAP